MNMKTLLSGVILIFFMGLSFVSTVGAKMYKEVAIGVMADAPSIAEMDRYYISYHGPDVVRASGPWMSKYQLWRPYNPPKEAVERFGAVRGRYAELWFTEDNYTDRPPLSGVTIAPWAKDTKDSSQKSVQTVVMVPANPTDTFYDSDPHPAQTSIVRWVTIIRYPDGVSVKDGEKWFLEVYAKEAVKQPGLLKFVSHRVAPLKDGSMTATGDKPAGAKDMPQSMSAMPSWVRVCEYWYTSLGAWRKAILESPPKYTVPPWGGKYPFVEMRSTFIPYYHDVDFLKGTYQINFEKDYNDQIIQ
jgi:hypothetical protein